VDRRLSELTPSRNGGHICPILNVPACVLALYLLVGCFSSEKPLPPAEALSEADRRIRAIIEENSKRNDQPSTLKQYSVTPDPNEILLWYYSHPILSETLLPSSPCLTAFRSQYPGITLSPQYIGEWGIAIQKLTVSLAAGEMPDLALVKRDWMARLAEARLLVPLDTVLPRTLVDDLRPPVRNALTIEGSLYGWPVDAFCSVLLYNRSLVMDPPPATWNELKRVASVAGRRNPDPRKNVFGIGDMPFLEALWSAGGEVYGSGPAGLAAPAASEALTFVLSLRDEGLASPTTLGNPEAALSRFMNGQAAMTVTSSANWPMAQRASFPVGVAPVPGKNGPISQLSDDVLVVFAPHQGDKRPAIMAVLDFLSGDQVQGKDAAAKGSPPVRESVRLRLAQSEGVPDGINRAFLVARATPPVGIWGAIYFELERYLALAYRWQPPSQQDSGNRSHTQTVGQ